MNGSLALFLAATLYGFIGVFSRIISFNIPLFFQAWSRNVLAVLLIFGLVKIFGGWKKLKPGDFKWFALRGLGGFISFLAFYISFIYLDFSTTYFISYAAATIAGYLLGYLFFKEKLNQVKLISLGLSIIGLFLIFRVNLNLDKSIYLVLSAVGGITLSIWTVFSKKISGIYSNLQMNLIDSIFALSFPLSLSLILREQWSWPTLSWLWGANLLFPCLFIPVRFLIVYGFKKVEAQKGSLILLFDIVVGLLLGLILFKENVSLPALMGGALIVAAMIFPNINLKELSKNE